MREEWGTYSKGGARLSLQLALVANYRQNEGLICDAFNSLSLLAIPSQLKGFSRLHLLQVLQVLLQNEKKFNTKTKLLIWLCLMLCYERLMYTGGRG